jgi:hypothetical protein
MKHNKTANKINPKRVKELVKETKQIYQQPIHIETPVKKSIRIWDEVDEAIRRKNIEARHRTNELYNDEYFKKFHSPIKKAEEAA